MELGGIERPRSILGGAWSSEGRWSTMFGQLIGATVEKVEFWGNLPEISVSLSNGLRIVSFMIAGGQPEWAILSRLPRLGSLCVKVGRLYVEEPES